MSVYGDTDLQQYKLETQLSLLPDMVQSMGYDTSRFGIADLLDFFQALGNARKLLFSEICILGKLMLVMPATNAVSERSFSALTLVKTYLRSTTGEARLNHLTLLHVHKELADCMDMVEVAYLFVKTITGASVCLESFRSTIFQWSLRSCLRQLKQSKWPRTYFDDLDRWNICWFQYTENILRGSLDPKPSSFKRQQAT